MGKGADIERLFQQRSELAKRNDEFILTNVPLDRIRPAKENFYGIRDIELLAEDIEARGLDENILLRAPDAEGMHVLIAGERRYRAFQHLYSQGKMQYGKIPSKIRPPEDDLRTEFSLVMNNAMARHLTPKEQAEQAAALKRIIEGMKREGYPVPGRVQEYVAQLMHLSSSHAGNLLKVAKDLHPGLKDLLGQEEIGIKEARALSNLPQAEQAQVVEAFSEEGQAAVKKALHHAKERARQEPRAKGAAGAGQVEEDVVVVVERLRDIADTIAGRYTPPPDSAAVIRRAAKMLEDLSDR